MAPQVSSSRRARWRRVLLSLSIALPVLSAAALGVGLTRSNPGAIGIGIGAAVLVPLASIVIYFVREEKLET
jgi:hypothetical protein